MKRLRRFHHTCKTCHKEFEREWQYWKRVKYDTFGYCSYKCYREHLGRISFWKSGIKYCTICGKKFQAKVKQVYCSKECETKSLNENYQCKQIEDEPNT
jgi:predicted glycosyl hydrolase (DUF1957 family)